jgi:hypothetical protein
VVNWQDFRVLRCRLNTRMYYPWNLLCSCVRNPTIKHVSSGLFSQGSSILRDFPTKCSQRFCGPKGVKSQQQAVSFSVPLAKRKHSRLLFTRLLKVQERKIATHVKEIQWLPWLSIRNGLIYEHSKFNSWCNSRSATFNPTVSHSIIYYGGNIKFNIRTRNGEKSLQWWDWKQTEQWEYLGIPLNHIVRFRASHYRSSRLSIPSFGVTWNLLM